MMKGIVSTMIKTYSKARDGNTKLSENFRVGEFACKDGTDLIRIDLALVSILQRIRNWAGASVKLFSSNYEQMGCFICT